MQHPFTADHMHKYQLYINGEWKDPSSGEWFESHEPFSGKPWAEIPRGNGRDVDLAVIAAHNALEGPWGAMSATDRGSIIHKLGVLVEVNAEKLAQIEMRDNGKVFSEVLSQVKYTGKYLCFYAGLADKIHGQTIPIDKAGVFNYTRHEPIGVVATITPWNSSLVLTAWKLGPALAAGNTVVCKPSEFTSASLYELARLIPEAGFPKGVVNIVTGYGDEVGEPLVLHPLVGKVAFTGGEQGGRRINELAARSFKRVSLELGGKSPNIIFDDADLDNAARGAITGIFSAGGQTCMAGSRLLVQESVYEEVLQKLEALTKAAKIGDPALPDTQFGPIATRPHFNRVLSYIEIARAEGARCITGGKALTGPGYGAGQFIAPTIFADVTNRMRIAQEEVFGPVLAVIRFKDEEDAITIANDINYGLAAGVWTKSLERAMLLSERLKAGTVWVNNYRSTSFTTPFGGYKASGLGREGGTEAVKEYLNTKSVWLSSNLKMPNPFVRSY